MQKKGSIIKAMLFSIIIILSALTKAPVVQADEDDPSNARYRVLASSFTPADHGYYSEELIFPVERECKAGDFEPDTTSAELVSLWSDLLSKFYFANEELIPSKDVLILEKVSGNANAYSRLQYTILFLVACFAIVAVMSIILIPIIGCGVFHICDFLYGYVLSFMFKKIGRFVIISYYKSKINHIRQTKPEQLQLHHFRLPKYFRNQSDTEDLFVQAAGANKVFGYKQQYKDTSSSSEFDVEVDYKDVLVASVEEAEAKLTSEQKKNKQRDRRHLFERAKGRRQSLRLSVTEFGSSSDDDMEKQNLSLWEFQMRENALYKKHKDKPIGHSEMIRVKKTLLQELREERLTRREEFKEGELEKGAGGMKDAF